MVSSGIASLSLGKTVLIVFPHSFELVGLWIAGCISFTGARLLISFVISKKTIDKELLLKLVKLLTVCVLLTIIAAFFSINSYLCLIFINGKGTILPLVDKLWIGFLPMLISTFVSSWVLLDLDYTAIDDIIHSDDKGAIEIPGMLTMDSLKYLNYIAMGLLYCYVAFCFRVIYKLSLLKSIACTIMPTTIMYLFILLIILRYIFD